MVGTWLSGSPTEAMNSRISLQSSALSFTFLHKHKVNLFLFNKNQKPNTRISDVYTSIYINECKKPGFFSCISSKSATFVRWVLLCVPAKLEFLLFSLAQEEELIWVKRVKGWEVVKSGHGRVVYSVVLSFFSKVDKG